MKQLIFSVILASAAVLPSLAQTDSPKAYTLNECLVEAIKSNLQLRNADNQVRMSAEQRKQAFTNYFPTISAPP